MLNKQSTLLLILFFLFLTTFSACRKKNRIDWDALKRQYSENPADSIKLAAVEFYRQNLPGIVSEIPSISDIDGSELTLKDMKSRHFNADSVARLFNHEDYRRKGRLSYDSEILTTDQLKRYIDEAFESWNNAPWKKDIPKQIFLEYLLPYMIFNDYPSDWRKILKQDLSSGYKIYQDTCTLDYDKNKLVFTDSLINKFIIPQNPRWFTYDKSAVQIGAAPSFEEIALLKKGDCFYEAAINNYLMKSVGIPSGFDLIPFWGNGNGGHSVAVYWNAGQQMMRLLAGFPYKPAKVFRRTFKNHQLWDKEIKPIVGQSQFDLDFLKTNYIKDVTKEHVPTVDIEIGIPVGHHVNYAYLAVLNYCKCTPIYWAPVRKNKALFKDMGKGVLYRLLLPGTKPIAQGTPFLLTDSGQMCYPTVSVGRHKLRLTNINSGNDSYVKLGRRYRLLMMNTNDEMVLVEKKTCLIDFTLSFNSVPKARFYELTEDYENKSFSRPFEYISGRQLWH